MYERIFVAVDGSAASRHALAEALELARVHHATVRVVHVVDVVPPGAQGGEYVDFDGFRKAHNLRMPGR